MQTGITLPWPKLDYHLHVSSVTFQGFEYPFEDPITYYDGQLLEAEFINLVNDRETRFDMLKCRLASATKSGLDVVALLASVLILVFGIPMMRGR